MAAERAEIELIVWPNYDEGHCCTSAGILNGCAALLLVRDKTSRVERIKCLKT